MKRLLALMVVVAVAVCIGCSKEAPKKAKTPAKETPPPVMKGAEKPAQPAPSAEKKEAPAEKKEAPAEKKDAPPPAPEKKDAPPPAPEKKDAPPPAPEKK